MSDDSSQRKRPRLTDPEQEEQEEVWQEVFRMFDKNGDGRVSSAEIGIMLRGLDMNPTQKELDEIIQKVDANNTGQIELEEFSSFMRHMKRRPLNNMEQMEEMIRAFKLFDYNNDDHIDANELRRVVTSMGEKLTLEEANQMIQVADIDQDGRINYKEFVKFLFAPCI